MLLEKFRSFLRRRPKDRKGSKLHVETQSQPTHRADGYFGQGPGPGALSGWGHDGGIPRGIPDPSPQNGTAGFFTGAHDMIIQNSTMVSQTVQNFGVNDTALRILEGLVVSGAELDSSDRHPPRCHTRTRIRLRRDIIYWFIDPNRAQYMLWILGPVGVGKSAIAQTIGEYCKSKGTLGAAFFFSRLGYRDDPLKLIPSIAYQLAVRHPTYNRLVTRSLAKDTKIPFRDLRSQFRELIVKPFEALNRQETFTNQRPLVIIIDGLDECRGDDAQCELILLINECAQVVRNLLWIVCSRPEWHLRRILSRPDSVIRCWCEELSVDDEDSRMDVYLFLKDGFKEIQQRSSNILDPRWPSRADVKEISTRASGLFVFASTVLTYVGGNKEGGTPDVNLNACLRFIRETPISAAMNPFRALDFLYFQIISKIPSQFFSTAMRILSLSILYDTGFTFWEMCVFLGIDRGSFYSAFMPLPAVLHVPDQYHATETRLMFYHSSFGEFLRSPHRSGEFALDEPKARIDITIRLLRWYNFFINKNCKLGQQFCIVSQPHMSWVPSHGRVPTLEKIRDFCHYNCWSSFQYLDNVGTVPRLMMEIEQFRFCHLRWLDRTFTVFIRWYHSNNPATKPFAKNIGVRLLSKIVRSERKIPPVRNWITNEIDRFLVVKYGSSRISWAENVPQATSNVREITSLHFDTDSNPTRCQVFFLGCGEYACLVEMWREQ